MQFNCLKNKKRLLANATTIAVGCAAIIFTFYLESTARQSIANALIERNLEKVSLEMKNFFMPVRQSLLVSKKWAQNSSIPDISKQNVKALNAKFTTLMELEDFGAVSAVIAADSDGRQYLLQKNTQGWLVKLANIPQHGQMTVQEWENASTLTSSKVIESTYSPTTRPWYKNAMTHETFSWTQPYTFSSTGTPGITASLKVRPKNSPDTEMVLACDIKLTDLRNFINSFKTTPMGSCFVIDSNQTLLAANTLDTGSIQTISAFRQSSPPEKRHMIDQFVSWRKNQTEKTFSYMSNGMLWWCGIEKIQIDNMLLYTGVVIPEKDFLNEINKRHDLHLLIIIGIAATTVLVLILLNTVFKLAARQKHFSNQPSLELIKQGESTTVEFKSTLRMNLKSEKAGKEIELAWIKAVVAFLNTKGGTLFIGIKDDGSVHGLESDNFANEDKLLLHFNNLINTHLGLEFSKFINVALETMQGQRIMRVTCTKSDRPAFLKQGETEDFYIRSGPSSRKLTTSKALLYIKKNKL